MALPSSLAAGSGHTDGKVTRNLLLRLEARHWFCRKRQHIGCLVFSSKLAIETAYRRIGRKQHRYLATQPDSRLRKHKKTRQGASARKPVSARNGCCRCCVRWIAVQIWVEDDHRTCNEKALLA